MRNRLINVIGGVVALVFGSVMVLQAGSAPNLLNITPGVLQFSATGVGSTYTLYSSPSISNLGAAPVIITGFSITGAQPGDFILDPGTCPLSPNSLPPGQSCYPNLSFTPSAAGLRLAALVVKDAGGAPQTVLLTGEGLAATKVLSLAVSEVTFPSVPVGPTPLYPPTAFVQAQNTGNVPVKVQSVAIVGAGAADFQTVYDGCSPAPIPAGGTCYLSLSFWPTGIGLRRASLLFIDDAQGGAQSVKLIGVGAPAVNMLQVFPAGVAFTPTVTGNGVPAQVTVENTGSEPATIDAFRVTGQNASDFSLVQNSCQPLPYTLMARDQCSLEVQFTPGAVGARLANLEIADSVPGSPQTVPLEGTGVVSTISLSFNPNPVPFVVTPLGQTNSASTVLQNLGTGMAQISLQIQGSDAADFSVTNYCSSLNPYSSCDLALTFTPSALGIRVATLVATDSISGQSQSLFLVGSGVSSGSALGTGAAMFPPVAVGVPSTSVLYLYNQTQSPVTITQFTLSGGAKSDFGIVQNGCRTGTVVNQSGYCAANLIFTSSAVGTRVAAINIGYSGDGSPISVPLAAAGLPPSRTITFNTGELAFAVQPLGVPADGSASIANTGSEAVSIANVSIAGPDAKDYAIVGNPCPQAPATLAPGYSCQVSVQFTPSVPGARLARLQVADNASGSPQSLPFVGFGTNAAPPLQISTNVLNFNSEPLGSSVQQYVMLQAFNGMPVSFSGLRIVGPNASDFTSVNDCPATITSYCDVYVTFTPSVTGVRFAEFQIQDNAIGSPQVIPLGGMGATVVPPAGSIGLLPIPLTFSLAQGIGYTASASIAVTNTGTKDVLLSKFQIGGRAANDFGIQANNCPLSPAPLPPNLSCSVTIEFTPSATGVRLATFTVTDNAPGSPQSISIVGKGAAAVKTLQAAPSNLIFNPTPVGTTDYFSTVFVYNTGTAPVTFKNFGFAGADQTDFSIGQNYCPITLNPGSNCQVGLNFTPSATGNRTARLTIESDATPGKQTVQLTGTGL